MQQRPAGRDFASAEAGRRRRCDHPGRGAILLCVCSCLSVLSVLSVSVYMYVCMIVCVSSWCGVLLLSTLHCMCACVVVVLRL